MLIKKIEDFFLFYIKKISNVINFNKNFDIFLSSSKSYNNFDDIQNNIKVINENIDFIVTNSLYRTLKDKELKENFIAIEEAMKKKNKFDE